MRARYDLLRAWRNLQRVRRELDIREAETVPEWLRRTAVHHTRKEPDGLPLHTLGGGQELQRPPSFAIHLQAQQNRVEKLSRK